MAKIVKSKNKENENTNHSKKEIELAQLVDLKTNE
jgi:hypothetical protein